jgi:RNA polymerase sigma factor (sigma-70 family)
VDPSALDDGVEAARRGDRDAFGRLWQQLSPAVAAYFRAQGVPEGEDLTSEVFLAAFRQMPRFVGSGAAFRALVFAIAHRRQVDWWRGSARRGNTQPWHELGEDALTTGSAENAALSRLGEDRVVALLRELTPDQRSVLALRVLADLSLETTAQVLGRDIGSVKSLQHRALARLRRKVGANPYPASGTGRLNTRHA